MHTDASGHIWLHALMPVHTSGYMQMPVDTSDYMHTNASAHIWLYALMPVHTSGYMHTNASAHIWLYALMPVHTSGYMHTDASAHIWLYAHCRHSWHRVSISLHVHYKRPCLNNRIEYNTFLGSRSSRWFWQNCTLDPQSEELNSYGMFQPSGPNFLLSWKRLIHNNYSKYMQTFPCIVWS